MTVDPGPVLMAGRGQEAAALRVGLLVPPRPYLVLDRSLAEGSFSLHFLPSRGLAFFFDLSRFGLTSLFFFTLDQPC